MRTQVFPPKLAGRYRGYRNRMAICAGCKVEKEFYASFDELTAPDGPVCALCECGGAAAVQAEKPVQLRAARRPLFFASSAVACIDVASTARDERAAGFLTQVCADCFDRAPEFAGLEDCLSHGICEAHFAAKLAEIRRAD